MGARQFLRTWVGARNDRTARSRTEWVGTALSAIAPVSLTVPSLVSSPANAQGSIPIVRDAEAECLLRGYLAPILSMPGAATSAWPIWRPPVALAEGNVHAARRYAARAQKKLKPGSPAWLQADDIVSYKPTKP